MTYQSKNFLPPIDPSQSPREFGSWSPTKISSASTEATGPQYRMRPTTTRPVLAITFASWPGFRHFGDFGRNGSDCFDGWKSRSKGQSSIIILLCDIWVEAITTKRPFYRYHSTQLTPLNICLGASSIGFPRFTTDILITMSNKFISFL